MQIALWDVNPEVFFAWTQVFGELEEVAAWLERHTVRPPQVQNSPKS